MSDAERPAAAARAAMVGRRELALLDDPSVPALATLLARRCREPGPWVRAAVGTLDRFRTEVADGDLSATQLASLAFGPRLWWTVAGAEVRWRPLSATQGARPLPGGRTDADVRLLLLAAIGTGATETELLDARMRDAGRLDGHGAVVPDLEAEPLALTYRSATDGGEHLTFLSFEARQALHRQLARRGRVGPDEPLLLPSDRAVAAAEGSRAASAALIGAGNDVNVATCRATGDFFRA